MAAAAALISAGLALILLVFAAEYTVSRRYASAVELTWMTGMLFEAAGLTLIGAWLLVLTIQLQLGNRRRSRDICLRCHYDQRGCPGNVCPECGLDQEQAIVDLIEACRDAGLEETARHLSEGETIHART